MILPPELDPPSVLSKCSSTYCPLLLSLRPSLYPQADHTFRHQKELGNFTPPSSSPSKGKDQERVLARWLGIACSPAKVQQHTRLISQHPGIMAWRDQCHFPRANFCFRPIVHHDLRAP
jgi:hypothetical protein